MTILNTCSFQKKLQSNLTCVLIYSLTKCVLKYGFKESCVLKNFVKLAEICPWQSLLLRNLQYLKPPLFERSAKPNITS